MTSRRISVAVTAAVASLLMGGCTANSPHTSAAAATPTAGSTATAGLPDPVPSDLPVGARVLIQRQGTGTTTLDLTSLVGSAKTVNIRWTCVGHGGVKITGGASKTIVVGGCANTAAEATYLGGVVPLSIVSSLRWTLQAEAATRWRIAVTTGN
ncbi:MAG: hypothetical protein ACRDVE_08785 [Actinocrinis sp.]